MDRPDRSRRSLLATLGVAAIGLKLSPGRLLAADDDTEAKLLKLYSWETYTGKDTLGGFLERTGISVQMQTYSDNDTLFRTIAAGEADFDLIVPSDTTVNRMIRGRLLRPLDHALIPNIVNIDPSFMRARFDPGRKYSLPYMWGTIGIGYRKSRVDGVPDSWRWLYDSDRYAGRIALLKDDEALIQMALKYLGHSINTINAGQIEAAVNLIIRQKPRVARFADDDGQELLRRGEVDLVQEWSGDILQIVADDDDLDYVVPREGSLLWQDSLCIPTRAAHPGNAHAFINYVLDAEVGARIARSIRYATPNLAARKLLPGADLADPALYPPADVLARCEVSEYRGELMIRRFRDGWRRIEAA